MCLRSFKKKCHMADYDISAQHYMDATGAKCGMGRKGLRNVEMYTYTPPDTVFPFQL